MSKKTSPRTESSQERFPRYSRCCCRSARWSAVCHIYFGVEAPAGRFCLFWRFFHPYFRERSEGGLAGGEESRCQQEQNKSGYDKTGVIHNVVFFPPEYKNKDSITSGNYQAKCRIARRRGPRKGGNRFEKKTFSSVLILASNRFRLKMQALSVFCLHRQRNVV